MSLFVRNLHSWGSQVLTHLLSFSPLLEKSQGKKVLLSSKLWCLGGGVIHARSSCFSYLLQTHPFFSFSGVLELLLWKPRFLQRVSCLWVTAQVNVLCSLYSGQEGLELVHRPLQGPQPWRSLCPLLDTQVGETPPESPGVWCHNSHRSTFVSGWISNFCHCGGRQEKRDSLCHHNADLTSLSSFFK